jgi:hypothetical protein
MTCDEFRRNAASLALGVASAEVRRASQQHLANEAGCGGCAAHLEHARRIVVQLGLALPPVRPSEEAWRRLEALVGTAAPAQGFRGRALLAWLLPGLLAVLLGWQRHRADAAELRNQAYLASVQQRGELQRRAWHQLAQGSARVVRVPAQGEAGQALAVVDPSTRRAWLWASGLPAGQRWSIRWQWQGRPQALGEAVADLDGELVAELVWPPTAELAGEALWLSTSASND